MVGSVTRQHYDELVKLGRDWVEMMSSVQRQLGDAGLDPDARRGRRPGLLDSPGHAPPLGGPSPRPAMNSPATAQVRASDLAAARHQLAAVRAAVGETMAAEARLCPGPPGSLPSGDG